MACTNLRALVLSAHPEPRSFSSAQAAAAAAALMAGGVYTDRVDLYAEKFNPLLDRHEFGVTEDVFFKPAVAQRMAFEDRRLPPDVERHLQLLLDADLLVLSFPMWWFSAPSILKGWLDRVLIPGVVYGHEFDEFEGGRMHGKVALLLVTTGETEDTYTPETRYGAVTDLLVPITRSLEFVGYRMAETLVAWKPSRMTDTDKGDALHRVASSVRTAAELASISDH